VVPALKVHLKKYLILTMLCAGLLAAANSARAAGEVPAGVGNNLASSAVSKFAAAALRSHYSNSSDQYVFSAVDNIVYHDDGRLTGDMVMKYKNSDMTVRLQITLDKKHLTIRNAWGHVMGVYPIASGPVKNSK
jgi:hypothetical protein